MSEKTAQMKQEFLSKLENVADMASLDALRVEYLGKNGLITGLLKEMKNLSVEEKKTFGQEVNILKNEATDAITTKIEEMILFFILPLLRTARKWRVQSHRQPF